ncbi:hypothetical protein SUGI_0984640 [Cryptomeria japonica]|nr:hypothetical protein SUGI_0984640 [Cryptomeria japonica]
MACREDSKGKGHKLNPSAPPYYPTLSPILHSYTFYSAPQLPWNLPIIAPPLPRFILIHTVSSPQIKLVAFNVDASISNSHLHEIFRQFGTIEKVDYSPNDHRIRFITFFDAEHANRTLTALNGRRVGLKRLRIEVSHWSPGPNPTISRRPNNIPPRLQQQKLKDA